MAKLKMKLSSLISFPDMPFCVGACSAPNNPRPLPNCFPMELCLNEESGALQLSTNGELEQIISMAYSIGIEMGTPSDDTDFGRPYVLDFLKFLKESTHKKGRALEIGAGVGYLSSLLSIEGWHVDSLEPGQGYKSYWEKYKINVISDFFPSMKAIGPYDLIVFYTVLEHISDVKGFLNKVIDCLAPDGVIVLAVPDCTEEIEAGDPSMLLHEHYQYFVPSSLRHTLMSAGLYTSVQKSGYGRALYAYAKSSSIKRSDKPNKEELKVLKAYPKKVRRLTETIQRNMNRAIANGTIGIYCPARALAVLPHDAPFRFFDDSPDLHGKYYPPFQSRIESRDELFENPPDTLWIMSRTFGENLKNSIEDHLPRTKIALITELNEDGSQ
ncbi:MAG: class I SAM-dependent methyltransferase [Syntrophales bacterium LBB04]|nr:class I SAM-dependent methyltransferase [Syntrophales bacterium LBB04]